MIEELGVEHVKRVNELISRDFPGTDATEFLSNPLNVCLVSGDSGTFFAWRGPGIYETHVFFGARGKRALEIAHEKLAHMRRHHAARYFWSLIPTESRKVKVFARSMGWKCLGIKETAEGPCELYVSEEIPCPQQS